MVTKKWESLRDGFKKALAKEEKRMRSGAASRKPAKYVYHEQMQWLVTANKKKQ